MNVTVRFKDIVVKDVPEKWNVKVLMLKGEKGDVGEPTQDQVDSAVADWLDDHPEATTTVEDGAIALPKLADDVTELLTSSAKQLLSTNYTEDKVPYVFRKSAGGTSDREFDEIVGGTIAWNQLFEFPNDTSATSNGVTVVDNRDGSYTISTVSGGATADTLIRIGSGYNIPVLANHVYLKSGANTSKGVRISDSYSGWILFTKDADIFKKSINSQTNFQVNVLSGTIISTPVTIYPQFIDLTQTFGSTVADAISSGSGVELFRSLFPKPYYPYNEGELISVSGLSAHKMTGFNQWDEEWEQGSLDTSGVPTSSATQIRTKNYIPCFPSTQYYVVAPSDVVLYQYDANKNYITRQGIHNATITLNADTHYLKFRTGDTYGTTYNHDICINFSGDRNGQYEPYESHSYALDDSLTLRGVPKLNSANEMYFDGDVYSSDGTVQRRYGIVDLGTLTWNGNVTNGHFYISGQVQYHMTQTVSMICDRFVFDGIGSSSTAYYGDIGTFRFNYSGSATAWELYFCDTPNKYGSVDAFKTAMNGVYLVYELATPTTESASPYVNPQINSEYGTEEYVSAEQSGVTMIVGHNTKYPQNLRKKIEGLPWNFSSLIAPTEVTNKATRNYTVGSYLIMNNTLYKVTSAIANGGTITVGSNVTATTIMQEILAL